MNDNCIGTATRQAMAPVESIAPRTVAQAGTTPRTAALAQSAPPPGG